MFKTKQKKKKKKKKIMIKKASRRIRTKQIFGVFFFSRFSYIKISSYADATPRVNNGSCHTDFAEAYSSVRYLMEKHNNSCDDTRDWLTDTRAHVYNLHSHISCRAFGSEYATGTRVFTAFLTAPLAVYSLVGTRRFMFYASNVTTVLSNRRDMTTKIEKKNINAIRTFLIEQVRPTTCTFDGLATRNRTGIAYP